MTTTIRAETSVLHGHPAYEGVNIRTWVGFKHFIYLVEHAVLQWLRDQGFGARTLFLEHGLGVEIADSSVQLPAVLELDDAVRAEVSREKGDQLTVRLSVVREGSPVTVLRGRVRVALVPERTADRRRPAPAPLADLVGTLPIGHGPPRIRLAAGVSPAAALTADPAAFVWSWRAPYFYCHFSDRVQHSGFVRTLEEVVDRFLADRGISVGRLLTERSWIPVVSRARVRLLDPAHMEETVHTTFRVTDVLRNSLFEAEMSCYVERGGELVPVATARILHGYAIGAGAGAGGMAELTDDVVRALIGGGS